MYMLQSAMLPFLWDCIFLVEGAMAAPISSFPFLSPSSSSPHHLHEFKSRTATSEGDTWGGAKVEERVIDLVVLAKKGG